MIERVKAVMSLKQSNFRFDICEFPMKGPDARRWAKEKRRHGGGNSAPGMETKKGGIPRTCVEEEGLRPVRGGRGCFFFYMRGKAKLFGIVGGSNVIDPSSKVNSEEIIPDVKFQIELHVR